MDSPDSAQEPRAAPEATSGHLRTGPGLLGQPGPLGEADLAPGGSGVAHRRRAPEIIEESPLNGPEKADQISARPPDVVAAIPLAQAAARGWGCRMRLQASAVDDMVQAGCEAACRAARTFDPAQGSFATYARTAIEHAVRDEAFRLSTVFAIHSKVALAAVPQPVPVTEELDPLNSVPASAPSAESACLVGEMFAVLAEMPQRRGMPIREIVARRVLGGEEFSALGREYGVSREAPRLTFARGINALREALDEEAA